MASIIERAQKFIGEVRVEARKVSWPSREEVRQSTIVVIVSVWVLAVFIFVVDWLLNRGAQMVL
ncbi:MAG: preprotein translocase subunit SecE [Candidatus Eisenbacteria bacterium]